MRVAFFDQLGSKSMLNLEQLYVVRKYTKLLIIYFKPVLREFGTSSHLV